MKILAVFLGFCLCILLAQFSVPIAHNDAGQAGANLAETTLTRANVAAGKFGLRGSYAIDGLVWAQPLYLPDVLISGALRNLLIVATMNNSVYAFNADSPGSAAIWHTTLESPRSSYPNVNNCGGSCDPTQYGAALGIMGTPVADVAAGKLYVANTNNTPTWVLSQLSLTDGTVLQSATITGTVAGVGDPQGGDTASGGLLTFYPAFELNRTGLSLGSNRVYIAFTSYGDIHPWHGWVFAYNVSDLSRAGIWCSSPNTGGNGIWQSGRAPVVDSSGNVYVTTGNGAYDGITAYGETVAKLSPTLTLLDWFTPSNFATLDALDADLSSSGPVLIPDTNLIAMAGKDFNVYLIDTACMGHLQGSSGCSLQTFKTCAGCTVTGGSGSYGALYFNSVLYLPTTAGSLYGYTFSSGSFNTTPVVSNTASHAFGFFPGASQMAGSGTGSNAILWITTAESSSLKLTAHGTLRALNPTDLSELWNSNMIARDSLGTFAKFTSPTVADGQVFVPNQDGAVQVYGLTSSSGQRGTAVMRGTAVNR